MAKIKWYNDGKFGYEEFSPDKKFGKNPKIKVFYNGKYPNLCYGDLKVKIDDVMYNFPSHSLTSGGGVCFDGDWYDHVESGPWTVNNWPNDFPEELKDAVIQEVNDSITWGCCGGCI